MRRIARDICESLEQEPGRWRVNAYTYGRDDGIEVWRANIPLIDMRVYRPVEIGLGFAGRLAVRRAFRRWLREMPLAGYPKSEAPQ